MYEEANVNEATERVAKALYLDDPITNFGYLVAWDEIKAWSRDKYRKRAIVAIESLQVSASPTQVGAA